MIRRIKHAYRILRSKVREKKKSKSRSPAWDETRDVYLKLHPYCEACGYKKNIQVHHIKPFHSFPELELDLNNLISLCMGPNECHIELGHGDNFKYYNPNIETHAKIFLRSSQSERELIRHEAKSIRKR